MMLTGRRSLPLKHRGALLKKRTNAFLIVGAVVDLAAHGLYALKGLGTKIVRGGQEPELFFEQADDQRRIGGDLRGHGLGKALQLVSGHGVADNSPREQ